ncbi:MAG TPA: glycosyltransferase, partial [Pirellulales bacterium]|nr:glycosyltransferase [Pirellulales bacterium]
MQISFLLVNFNMSGIVSNCVHNIQARCSSRVEYEIIIADNSTNPQFRLPANFIQEHPHVRHVVLEENRGWVAAINSIRQLACGEFVAIMHPDVELSENCIEGLIDFL